MTESAQQMYAQGVGYQQPVNSYQPINPTQPVLVDASPTAEPGYTTTEFWLTLGTSLMGVLTMFHIVSFTDGQTQALIGLLAIVIPQMVYAISRGLRKQGTQG